MVQRSTVPTRQAHRPAGLRAPRRARRAAVAPRTSGATWTAPSSRPPGVVEARLDEEAMQLRSERHELLRRRRRGATALGVPLAQHREDELLDAIDLAVRCEPVGAQVSRFEPASQELSREPRRSEGDTVEGSGSIEEPVGDERVDILDTEAAGVGELGPVEHDVAEQRSIVRGVDAPMCLGSRRGLGLWWKTGVDAGELLLDHPQRQVAVALRGQDVAETLDVLGGELPVAGLRATGTDQPLGLEEADLRDGDVREVLAEQVQDLSDRVALSHRPRRRSPRRDPRGSGGGSARSGPHRRPPARGCRRARRPRRCR